VPRKPLLWGGYANVANYPAAIAGAGLYFSQAIIWVKEWPVLTRKDFMGNHEWCFYGWKEGAAHFFNPGITNASDVWKVKKVNPMSMVHLTEKRDITKYIESRHRSAKKEDRQFLDAAVPLPLASRLVACGSPLVLTVSKGCRSVCRSLTPGVYNNRAPARLLRAQAAGSLSRGHRCSCRRFTRRVWIRGSSVPKNRKSPD
jgi:hypothetical protein